MNLKYMWLKCAYEEFMSLMLCVGSFDWSKFCLTTLILLFVSLFFSSQTCVRRTLFSSLTFEIYSNWTTMYCTNITILRRPFFLAVNFSVISLSLAFVKARRFGQVTENWQNFYFKQKALEKLLQSVFYWIKMGVI